MRFLFMLTLAAGFANADASMAQTADTILYNFTGGGDGNQPYGRLILDSHGELYGTTSGGGVGNQGNVFKLTPPAQAGQPWTETVLYSFTGGNDGGTPEAGLLFGPNGVLYGTASVGGSGCPGNGAGCGVVFELSPTGTSWKETVLYNFTGFSDGYDPLSELIMDSSGALYGTTVFGGVRDNGTVFKLSPPQAGATNWTETVLYRFTGKPDGANPEVAVAFNKSGVLYGTTRYGGASDHGVVFQLSPPSQSSASWTESVIHDFPTGKEHGESPSSPVFIDSNGRLYGETAEYNGIFGGTIYELLPPIMTGAIWRERVLYTFAPGKGQIVPSGGLVRGRGGIFYGTSLLGGPGSEGVIFSLNPPASGQSGWTETSLHDFVIQSDGQQPNGVTIGKSGVLYGTTSAGGTCASSQSGCGTVFSFP